METSSQPLATESFSYSWLATETEFHKIISNNPSSEPTQNFDFDISTSKNNPSSLVHADKLFSNGLILPRPALDEPSRAEYYNYYGSSTPSPLLISSSTKQHHQHHRSSSSSFRRLLMGKWSKFVPRKIISKYIKCLIPSRESIGRGVTRVDDVNNRISWEVKSWNNSNNNTPVIASPIRENSASYCSAAVWSDIDETSIRDAILYCKSSSNGFN